MITAVSSFKSDNISPSTNCSKANFNNQNINSVKSGDKDSFQRQKAGQPSFGMNTFDKMFLVLACGILLCCIL